MREIRSGVLLKLKRVIAFIVIPAVVAVALGAALIYQRWERGQRELLSARTRSEVAERAALSQYQRSLPIGTSRADVDKFLASENIPHFNLRGEQPTDGDSYEVRLPDEPGDGIACDRWGVSISLKFKVAFPSDTLREIGIKKIGHCL